MATRRTNRATLHAEWWWIASRIMMMIEADQIRRQGDDLPLIHWQSTPTTDGITFVGSMGNTEVLHMMITGEGSTTTINTLEAPAVRGFWKPIYEDVDKLAHMARVLRRESIGPTVDAIVEEYNRAQAAGERVTLKQLAEEAGVSYSHVRRRKSQKESTKRAGNKEGYREG